MKNPFRYVKTAAITLLLLTTVMILVVPSSLAASGPYACDSKLIIDYDSDVAMDPFLPIDRIKTIPLKLTFSIVGAYAEEIADLTQNTSLFVYLYADEKPEWCTVSFNPTVVLVYPSSAGRAFEAILTIAVDENAPAFSGDTITVRGEVVGIGSLNGGTFTKKIRFIPGYLPVIGIDTPNKNFKEISPEETAYFDVDLENLGNAKTKVEFDVLDAPDDWNITFPSNAVIDSSTLGKNTKKTVSISIEPPDTFGYHDEREVIKLSLTPIYYNNESIQGEKYYISFIVKSKGFSTPGFEAIFVFIAFFAVILMLKFQKSSKRRQK